MNKKLTDEQKEQNKRKRWAKSNTVKEQFSKCPFIPLFRPNVTAEIKKETGILPVRQKKGAMFKNPNLSRIQHVNYANNVMKVTSRKARDYTFNQKTAHKYTKKGKRKTLRIFQLKISLIGLSILSGLCIIFNLI